MTTTALKTGATFAEQPTTLQYIGGHWREGRAAKTLTVTNPYDDTVLTTIRQASVEDLDEAYRAAEQAQKEWARQTPTARRQVIMRAAHLLEERREEIVDWIVKESGSTVGKANVEVSLAAAITLEASSFPTRFMGGSRSPIPRARKSASTAAPWVSWVLSAPGISHCTSPSAPWLPRWP